MLTWLTCLRWLKFPTVLCPGSPKTHILSISVPESSAVLLSAPCRAILAALPSRPTLRARKGEGRQWGRGWSSQDLGPTHLRWLWASSTSQLRRGPERPGLCSTLRDCRQHRVTTVENDPKMWCQSLWLWFFTPATVSYMKRKNYI